MSDTPAAPAESVSPSSESPAVPRRDVSPETPQVTQNEFIAVDDEHVSRRDKWLIGIGIGSLANWELLLECGWWWWCWFGTGFGYVSNTLASHVLILFQCYLHGMYSESSTASVSASILEYRRSQGRTYHSDKFTTNYFLPNDDQQLESVDLTWVCSVYARRITSNACLDIITWWFYWMISCFSLHWIQRN